MDDEALALVQEFKVSQVAFGLRKAVRLQPPLRAQAETHIDFTRVFGTLAVVLGESTIVYSVRKFALTIT